ncbi:amidohydrolase family protein [Herbiconiux sp. YIM B11900]|uniref:amidohydrolase family protein n=1 Tax=Herbiconiux sp. YIM B11900 TaxID=3404131 RepID=UPI003F8425CC
MSDGVVQRVTPAGSGLGKVAEAGMERIELDGMLVLPAAADAHAHLDKAFSWDAVRPPAGDLRAAITSFAAFQREASECDILERARRAVLALAENGSTAIRSHVSLIEGEDPLRAIRALVRLRRELDGVLDLQLVALSTHAASDETIEAAIGAGVDLLGGAPHLSPDPVAQTRRLVGLAQRFGVGIDLHVDEDLRSEPTLGLYAELVAAAWPERIGGHATAGHCVRLGTLEPPERDRLIRAARDAGIGIVTLPQTNLYLQGRHDEIATPRGLPPLRALLDQGAVLGAGGDNVRDPFNPLGRSDPFETAMLLTVAGHLDPEEAWSVVSTGSRRAMGLADAGTAVGQVADLVAVRATSIAGAIAEAPADRLVIRRGRLVSRRHTVVERLWQGAGDTDLASETRRTA